MERIYFFLKSTNLYPSTIYTKRFCAVIIFVFNLLFVHAQIHIEGEAQIITVSDTTNQATPYVVKKSTKVYKKREVHKKPIQELSKNSKKTTSPKRQGTSYQNLKSKNQDYFTSNKKTLEAVPNNTEVRKIALLKKFYFRALTLDLRKSVETTDISFGKQYSSVIILLSRPPPTVV